MAKNQLPVIGLFLITAACASAIAASYRALAVNAPAPSPGGQWGERLADAGDLNGDRVNDVFAGSPSEGSGKVYALDGKALSRGEAGALYELGSPEPEAAPQFGFAISAIEDVNGDRIPDLAAGGTRAWVFSGKDASLLYELTDPNPQPNGRFGNRIGRAGDVNNDGDPDVMVGAPGNDFPPNCSASPTARGCWAGQGQVFLYSGSDGTLIRTLDLPPDDRQDEGCAADCGSFGLSVQGPGDVDEDGTPDQLVSAPGYRGTGRLYVFSGESGELLRRIDSPDPQEGASFGFQDVAPLSPGDVNGDGAADIYGNGFLQDGPAGQGQGRAWVFSGTNGRRLYELSDPTPQQGGQFGWSMTRTEFDADDDPDLYVGSSPHHVPGGAQTGGTYVFKGKDGSVLQALELPPDFRQEGGAGELGPNLEWSMAAPGDLNGDGQPDFVAGAPFTAVGDNPDQGVVFAFLSAEGPASGDAREARTPAEDGLVSEMSPLIISTIALLALVIAVAWVMLARRGRQKEETPGE